MKVAFVLILLCVGAIAQTTPVITPNPIPSPSVTPSVSVSSTRLATPPPTRSKGSSPSTSPVPSVTPSISISHPPFPPTPVQSPDQTPSDGLPGWAIGVIVVVSLLVVVGLVGAGIFGYQKYKAKKARDSFYVDTNI
eukprot:CAMPEP_0117030918 /NCGR_PEP_ID=MMETSP0472-20121206/22277_1 /TAXON_ID=693140 ORGANISM="Tiarina fusus, Strain LIS" /NCGR_SAMPLE_ID=MMETSP0472 /ASSEMBLY_ACC=CAM_ASM_000603 /LENGTH=136 /DNA_ID=CAMNT_0004739125 /DNA_START=14 /DNA_END=424 /DNA_ORIENTATION=-